MKSYGPWLKVQFRRKREGRTDYKYRLKLLRAKKPRLVVRVSLRHISVQVVNFSPTGDLVLVSAHTKQLKNFGWKGGTSNLPAAYLVGLLCGYRALRAGVRGAVLDIGMKRPTKGTKIFAVLKGALDAGLQVPHQEEILPSEERMRGIDISRYAERLKKEDEGTYMARFASYLSQGLNPEQIPDHFNLVKQEVIRQLGG